MLVHCRGVFVVGWWHCGVRAWPLRTPRLRSRSLTRPTTRTCFPDCRMRSGQNSSSKHSGNRFCRPVPTQPSRYRIVANMANAFVYRERNTHTRTRFAALFPGLPRRPCRKTEKCLLEIMVSFACNLQMMTSFQSHLVKFILKLE